MASISRCFFSVLSLLMAALPFPVLLIGNAEPIEDKNSLLDFLNKVPHSNRLDWNASASPCDWVGVDCDASRSYVSALRLPAVGLIAEIPAGTIGRLSQLRVLSLRSNGLHGLIPDDFSNLTLLRSLYLQENRLSGEFPASLTGLTRLTRLDLSSNNFSGDLPAAINNLTHLSRLYLQDNSFSGELPSLDAAAGDGGNLIDFNVSNNRFNGSIPKYLESFPDSSFRGNLQLCGTPLPACENSSSPPSAAEFVPSSPAVTGGHKRLSAAAIAGLVVAAAIVFLIILFSLVLCLIRRQRQHPSKSPKRPPAEAMAAVAAGGGEAGTSSSRDDITSGAVAGERNKLVFLGGGGYNFDLEDLLRASAEVLGKGSVGTSYKAVLEDGTTVVVKRLKDVTASKREFDMQMEVLGGCSHDNVVPIRAYYFSKDEKLVVCDHFRAGSLSTLLHGNKGSGRTLLDWNGRMKTALGAARGLAYLHVSSNVVHGNIKSSNVLLREDYKEAALSDFGLNPLFGNTTPQNRGAGYRAPEVLVTRKATFKSDVYSFGVLLLELVTGKAPNQTSSSEEGVDLPRWVQSVVREEWSAKVFDREVMMGDDSVEEEMAQLLQIAISCVQTVPDQRPTIAEVLGLMEGIARGGTDDSVRQPLDDPSRVSDGSALPVDRVDAP